MSDAKFKKGDRVRLTGKSWENMISPDPQHGDTVTIVGIDPKSYRPYFLQGGVEWYIYKGWEAELVEEPVTSPPPSDEYDDPKHESLIRQVEDLQAVIRRRNEQIGALEKELKETRALLDESTVGSALNNLADQLGLGAPEATSALELGARLFAQGITFSDIQEWREQERQEDLRVARRQIAREKRQGGKF